MAIETWKAQWQTWSEEKGYRNIEQEVTVVRPCTAHSYAKFCVRRGGVCYPDGTSMVLIERLDPPWTTKEKEAWYERMGW